MKLEIVIGMVLFVVILVLIIFRQYNTLIHLKMKVKQSKSGIDIYCQQRFDLIPNIIETVRGYMEHEKNIFDSITELRTQYNLNKDVKLCQKLEKQINGVIAIAESYPDLKSSEQFINLQKNLEKTESQLQAARRIYNNDVTNYNTKISMIPHNIIATIFGFKSEPLFELEDENISNNVSVKL